jgi:hypothetical protein
MKRPLVVVAALAVLTLIFASSHRALAQDDTPQPYPSADPHTYDDPAMHFQAPKGYHLIARRLLSVDELGDPQIVAGWVKDPGQQDMRAITISVEQFQGSVDDYKTTVSNEIRSKLADAIVANQQRTQTPNGMPAYFLSVTSGSGFNGQKIFELIWADGTRGVSISISGALGSLKEDEARKALANVSAVRYPLGRL